MIKIKNVVLFIGLIHLHTLYTEEQYRNSSSPACPQQAAHDASEILKHTAAVVMNGMNMVHNVDSAEIVLPSLANMFASMLNIAYLASRRSAGNPLSQVEFIEQFKAYLNTETGRADFEKFIALIKSHNPE